MEPLPSSGTPLKTSSSNPVFAKSAAHSIILSFILFINFFLRSFYLIIPWLLPSSFLHFVFHSFFHNRLLIFFLVCWLDTHSFSIFVFASSCIVFLYCFSFHPSYFQNTWLPSSFHHSIPLFNDYLALLNKWLERWGNHSLIITFFFPAFLFSFFPSFFHTFLVVIFPCLLTWYLFLLFYICFFFLHCFSSFHPSFFQTTSVLSSFRHSIHPFLWL